MNKFLLTALFCSLISLTFAQDTTTVISQTDLGGNWYSGSTAGGGQSFTITAEGQLTAFRFFTYDPEGITIIQLREGQDVNGNLLFSDTLDVNVDDNWFTVNLPSITVCPGVYCVTLNDFQWGASNATNPYPGGMAFYGSGWQNMLDMGFEVEQVITSTPPVPDQAALEDIVSSCPVYEENLSFPSATDFCSQNVTVTHNGIFPVYADTAVITWTYDDGNGGISTQTQQIIIVADTIAPEADLLGDLVSLCPVTQLFNPYAYDCSGQVSVSSDAVFPIEADTTIVTWTFTDQSGNSSTTELKVIVLPFNLDVTLTGNVLSVPSEENTIYQWINCATEEYIDNAATPSLDVTGMTGSFAVKAYRLGNPGCGAQSECVAVGFLNAETLSSDGIKIYPNPVMNELNIETGENTDKIVISDLQGRTVLSENPDGNAVNLDLSDLKSGTYIIQVIFTSGKEFISRIEKL